MEEEHRGISSGFVSEADSNLRFLGEKRNGNGLEEKDEIGSKRMKLDLISNDAKTNNLQSNQNIEIVQQSTLSSEHMSVVSEIHVAPDAEGLERLILPKTSSVSTDDANHGKLGLVKEHVSSCNGVLKVSNVSESGGSPGRSELVQVKQDGSLHVPVSEKVGSFQMCSPVGSLGESDSMRRWREMKRNGFLSGPLGGVAAPSSTVLSTPVEVVPGQKQQKVNKRRSDSVKKKNEFPKKEQIDRFTNVTAPSGLLTELNPGIINHVRSKKQVFSIIEAVIRNASDEVTTGGKHISMNLRGIDRSHFPNEDVTLANSDQRQELSNSMFDHSINHGMSESVRVDKALPFKSTSTGLSDNSNSFTNMEPATSLAVEAATVASQWLEFLHQDLSGRLSAVQRSRNRVQSILMTELPFLASRESLCNQEDVPQIMKTSADADAFSDKTLTEMHQTKWGAKFDQLKKSLSDEERDLENSLNQVREMQSRCNEGLRQMDEASPFSSQSSGVSDVDSSSGKDSNLETSLAVQAAAASIFSTCNFLLSRMKPTGS